MNFAAKFCLTLVLCGASPSHAQQRTVANPAIVEVEQKVVPFALSKKLNQRAVAFCGTALFGPGATSVWVVGFGQKQIGVVDFIQHTKKGAKRIYRPARREHVAVLEFWQSDKNSFRLLSHMVFPPLPLEPFAQRSADTIKLRWLFPAQRRGPVVIAPTETGLVVHTFKNGWNDPKPIVQNLAALAGEYNYEFDSVDKRGILEGSVFIAYPPSAEGNPGEWDSISWHDEGWKETWKK